MQEKRSCSWPSGLPKPSLPPERIERRDAREHRQRILEVARSLFAEYGVEAVSMHQIARAVGVGQGTLYRRYAHKGELCMDLLSERLEKFVEDIVVLFMREAPVTALERLEDVLTRTVFFLEEQGALLGPIAQIGARDWSCDTTGCLQTDGPFVWLHALFSGLLLDAVERNEIAELDIPYTADAILTALYPPFYRFQRQERGFSPERILQGLRHIYIDGLKTSHEATIATEAAADHSL